MPKPEEVDALLGDKKEEKEIEKPDTPVEPVVVPKEEYEKIASQYDNIRSLHDRQDNELHELREKVKKYEANVEEKSKVVLEDDEEDEALKARIKKLGFVSQDEADKQVERQLKLRERVDSLQNKMKETIEKMPFVKESEVLNFIKDKGSLTIDDAVKLMYPSELEAYKKSKGNEEVVQTDSGGRTIAIKSVESKDDAPVKVGWGRRSFAEVLAQRIEKNVQEAGSKL